MWPVLIFECTPQDDILPRHEVITLGRNGVGGMAELRDVWEEGAFHLERLQAAEECVNAEQALQASRQAPTWTLPFTPTWTPEANLKVGLPAVSARVVCHLVHHCPDA